MSNIPDNVVESALKIKYQDKEPSFTQSVLWAKKEEEGYSFRVFNDGKWQSVNKSEGGGYMIDEVYDISAANGNDTYTDLNDALTNGGVPSSLRKGGMSVKFIQTSDKYVQWRYMGTSIADADFTNVDNWQGVDDVPTVESENLVKSGGVYQSINLFNKDIVNRFIKEVYLPGIDYKTITKYRIMIAAERSGTYHNRINLFYDNDGIESSISLYNKTFQSEEDAIADLPNIPTFVDIKLGFAVLGHVDVSMAGTAYWHYSVVVNKDTASLDNCPAISDHISDLCTYSIERDYYIGSNGDLNTPSSTSHVITAHIKPGKKYKIINELYSSSRFISFTNDINGQTVVPHDREGESKVRSSYGLGVTIVTAPAAAKYMHITTQYDNDTDSFPYVTVLECDNDIETFKKETNESINSLDAAINEITEYTETDLSEAGKYYNNKTATVGNTFNKSTSNGSGWKCIKVRVHENDIVTFVATTVNSELRPYTLVDDRNIVILTGEAGEECITPPVTISVENDGYLYVNVKYTKMSGVPFTLTIKANKIDKLQGEIDTIIPDDANPLSVVKETAGLTSIIHKLGVIGASFTNGGHDKTSGTFPLAVGREFSWPQRLAKLCGTTVYNFGSPGINSNQWLDDYNGYYTQVGQSDYACDAYYISFASNDVGQSYPLGTISDVNIGNESENADSFYGYMSQIIARCHSVQSKAYLFMQTYPYNYGNTETLGYNQAMRDLVAAYRTAGYNIYLVDYATYGMTISQAQSKGMFRGSHFVGTGYQYMAYEICTYIDWIIKHNMDDFKDIAFVQTDTEYIE